MNADHAHDGPDKPSKDDTANDAEGVVDYSKTRGDKERRDNRDTFIVGGAILALIVLTILLLMRPIIGALSGDEEPSPEISLSSGAGETSSRQDTGGADTTETLGTAASSTTPATTSAPAQPVTAADLNLPATMTGDWSQVVNPRDRITSDTEMVEHIQQLIDSARTELAGVEVDPSNPDPRLQDVANFYLYGNQQATRGLADAAAGLYEETERSLTVYDTQRENIYTFTYYLTSTQGGPGFLMAGWYDPVSDSLKVHTASQTR